MGDGIVGKLYAKQGNDDEQGKRSWSGSRPTIGLFIGDASGQNGQLQWSGVADAAQARDVNLICFVGGMLNRPGGYASQANVLYDWVGRIDGLIVWSSSLEMFVERKEMAAFVNHHRPLPVVSVETAFEGIPAVLLSNYQGMREVMDHLIQVHDCRRIAFIRGPEGHAGLQERYRAYIEALEAHGVPLDPELITPPAVTFTPDEAAAMAQMLLDERKLHPGISLDAIVADNDSSALAVLSLLKSRDIRVPDDVVLAGFDNMFESNVVTPSLTTVQPPFYEMGWQAVDLMLDCLQGKPVSGELTVPTRLVIHQSCGCLDPTVAQAAVEPSGLAGAYLRSESLSDAAGHAWMARRQDVRDEAAEIVRSWEQFDLNWVDQLFDALAVHLAVGGELVAAQDKEPFLAALNAVLLQAEKADSGIAAWQTVLSILRRHALSCLLASGQPQAVERAIRVENLFGQARIVVGDMVRRAEVYRRYKIEQQMQAVRVVNQSLIAASDVSELMDMLAQQLPGIGVPGCYLALYSSPHALEWSNLVLAYHQQGRVSLGRKEIRFPSRELAPDGFLPVGPRYTIMLYALYFRQRQLGFIMFECGPHEAQVYEMLQGQISSALYGALFAEERDQVAVVLAREQSLLRALLDNVPDFVYFKDMESRFIRISRSFSTALGLSDPMEAVGKSDFDFRSEAQAREMFDTEQEIILTGQPSLNAEERAVAPDGREVWTVASKIPLRDENGQIVGTFGLSRDITALKRTEVELAQYAAAMERRATQFQISLEVARDVAAIRQMDELLNHVISLTHDRLGYDYVSVFLIDDPGEYAVMSAGTGDVGRQLFGQGFRLKVGQEGIVGRVAGSGEAQVVLDVNSEAGYVSHPLLPDIRSEAALPLQAGGQVIGVLDVQSNRVAAFGDEDVSTLSLIADQLAVAIENVRLLGQMEQTMREQQALTTQYTRESWQKVARGAGQLGYRYRRSGIEPITEQPPEAAQAFQLGKPVIVASTGESSGQSGTVAVPVRLRDQVVGVLNLRFQGQLVSDETVSMIEEVSNRLALSMESARLLQDTQRRSARDRVLTEAASRISESLDIHIVLKTAAREMRSALNLKEVEIKMGSAPSRSDHGQGQDQA